ncbi:MAG: serine/threonine protein kinase [Acidobacteria bacterium]|nr:MAG: serine/threonine protein kinase [Acidobacteriota bacterium]
MERDSQSESDLQQSSGTITLEATAAEPEDMLAPGEVVHQRYRIERLIGKGGMGEVYAAFDVAEGRRVALKTVQPERVSDKLVARFYQEYELSRRISHPNVLQIYEVFELERPGIEVSVPCMAMEFLDGETLLERLQRDQRLSEEEALPIVCQMASALAASHGAGVVHRDLKPDNVFLLPRAGGGVRAVLTDFGVARQARSPVVQNASFEKTDSLTATNVILGTPFYMAPEQLELETANTATDIYTFGLVIYEMITGTLPFLRPSTLQTVFARVREDPEPPSKRVPGLDPRWEATIMRCLERDPSKRFTSAGEICAALQGREQQPAASEPGQRERVPVTWIVLVFVVVLLLALLVGWWTVPP